MKKIFFSFLLVVLNLGVVASPASALSCMYQTPEMHVSSAQALFVGTVTGLNEVNAIGTGTIYPPQISRDKEKSYATFQVEKYWKTNPGSSVDVYNIYPWTGYVGDEKSFFKVGQKYIVYANYTNGKISASIDCGRTSLFTDAHQTEIINIAGQPTISPINPILPNPNTDKCSYTNITTDMWYGNYNNNRTNVLTLQNFLFRHYDVLEDITPNGFFGKLTRNYVLQFQKENGIRATGGVGSLTRSKIKELCGQTTPGICTREYMPVCGQPKFSCPAGSICTQQMPRPKTYSNKCEMTNAGAEFLYSGQCKNDVIPNDGAPANCKVWYDGCNTCSRGSVGGEMACTMMACMNNTPFAINSGATTARDGRIAICEEYKMAKEKGDFNEFKSRHSDWATYMNTNICSQLNVNQFANNGAYCKEYFSGTSKAPTISSFTGPVALLVGQKGEWKINASSPDNQSLNYKITWGDEGLFAQTLSNFKAFETAAVQATTFEHSYSNTGTYTVTIVVTNKEGLSAKTTSTVVVKNTSTTIGCYIGGSVFSEGTSKNSLPEACTRNAVNPCYSEATVNIMDSSYVCRSGVWKIEGGMMFR